MVPRLKILFLEPIEFAPVAFGWSPGSFFPAFAVGLAREPIFEFGEFGFRGEVFVAGYRDRGADPLFDEFEDFVFHVEPVTNHLYLIADLHGGTWLDDSPAYFYFVGADYVSGERPAFEDAHGPEPFIDAYFFHGLTILRPPLGLHLPAARPFPLHPLPSPELIAACPATVGPSASHYLYPMRILLALCCLACLTCACDDKAAVPIDRAVDEAYFPLELNRPIVYDLDSIIVFRTLRGVRYDTARSQVQEELVEAYEGADGQTIYRGERYQRKNENEPWKFVISYTLTRTATAALRTEDNLTFTKLVFPIRAGKTWDGHAAFDETRDVPVGGEFLDVYNNWDYAYTGQPTDTILNGAQLPATQLVTQAEVDNLIDRRFAYERYAPGVGLVERYLDARHTQCQTCCNGDTGSCLDLPWGEKAEKGFILHQVLREF